MAKFKACVAPGVNTTRSGAAAPSNRANRCRHSATTSAWQLPRPGWTGGSSSDDATAATTPGALGQALAALFR